MVNVIAGVIFGLAIFLTILRIALGRPKIPKDTTPESPMYRGPR